jgi:hypothetical protein
MTNDPFRRCWIAGLVVLVLSLSLLALGLEIWDLGSGIFSDPTPTAPPTPTSWPRARLASPEYGLQTSLSKWYAEAAVRDLELIHDAGFTWVKQHLGWRDVELEEGAYDWYFTDRVVADAGRLGLNLIFRLDRQPLWALPPDDTQRGPVDDPQDFGDFCHALADRYRGRVQAYQVWNEPNLAREWQNQPPDPTGYVALLRACYVGVKTADPEALVVSAGLAPTGSGPPEVMPDVDFLIAMYEAGAAPYFDLLGVHAPGYKAPPELSPEDAANAELGYGGQRFFCFRHVEDMRAIMVRYGDGDKQIAVLEMGWSIDPREDSPYHWHAVTEEQQADYLVRAFRYARENWSPWVGPMLVISIADPRWTEEDEQYWWAITEPGWPETRVRLAYEALREMEK